MKYSIWDTHDVQLFEDTLKDLRAYGQCSLRTQSVIAAFIALGFELEFCDGYATIFAPVTDDEEQN